MWLRRPKRSCGRTQEIAGSGLQRNFLHQRQGERHMATVTKLTPQEVSIIKARISRGDYQHRIAADFDLNQGRISEIATGKRFPPIR